MQFIRIGLVALLAETIISCSPDLERLPVFGHKQIIERIENGQTVYDTIDHTIPDFEFTDQEGNLITNQTFSNQIYVADFFFTSCPTICPVMQTQMLRVYKTFDENDEVAFLSHTIDPDYDNVEVLKDYADRLEVSSDRWHFVTGNKDEIYQIGEKSYLVAAGQDEEAPGGYLHSGAFLLIDKERRIRGVYDGTQADQVDLLIQDIRGLLEEYH